jgi:heme/copper-type cytochrome/quinol oxidase subunit 3
MMLYVDLNGSVDVWIVFSGFKSERFDMSQLTWRCLTVAWLLCSLFSGGKAVEYEHLQGQKRAKEA